MLSIWKMLSSSVGTGGVLHTTARAGIYYACKACIPVRLGVCVCVCVCVFASVCARQIKRREERERARLIITSAVTDSEFIRHSDNQCLHASARCFGKLGGLLGSQPACFDSSRAHRGCDGRQKSRFKGSRLVQVSKKKKNPKMHQARFLFN